MSIPFEQEYPETAAFMMRVFAAGGKFKMLDGKHPWYVGRNLPRIIGCDPYTLCPCGSGKKTKFCHKQFI